ncbi:MAG: hypothetical protein WDM80_09485 [Limisphaerales bacterium]
MKIETRIRKIAALKTEVKITRRKKSRTGFLLISPGGASEHFPNKKIALSALLAKLRCSAPTQWRIERQ